jgi:hypothetical protein
MPEWTVEQLEIQQADALKGSEQMHLTFNPEKLMTLIRETHLTNVACGAVREKAMDALSL